MRTVQVIRRLVPDAWGGIETVVTATVRELDRQGVTSRVLSTSALALPGTEIVDGISVERFRYAYLRVPPRPGLRARLDRKGGNPVAPGLVAALLTDRAPTDRAALYGVGKGRAPTGRAPDLFVSHTMGRLAGVVRAVGRLRGVPYVVFIHGGHADVSEEERRELRRLYAGTVDAARPLDRILGTDRVLSDAAAIVTLGAGEKAALSEAYPEVPVHLLPNGVHSARFAGATERAAQRFRAELGVPEGASMLLTVARIDPQKGQHVLLEAAARLGDHAGDHDHPVHVVLIGHPTRPDYLEELHRVARRSGIASRLHVVPGLRFDDPRLPAAYRAADVFVLPSLHEPFGIVILEAWAAGRAVVASRVGGIPTFAEHGHSALLTKPGDGEALAASLLRVLEDDELRARLGERGRAEARAHYDWEQVSARLGAIYREAARQR